MTSLNKKLRAHYLKEHLKNLDFIQRIIQTKDKLNKIEKEWKSWNRDYNLRMRYTGDEFDLALYLSETDDLCRTTAEFLEHIEESDLPFEIRTDGILTSNGISYRIFHKMKELGWIDFILPNKSSCSIIMEEEQKVTSNTNYKIVC